MMPISFDEVTADVQPAPTGASNDMPAPPAAPAGDIADQIDAQLRLRAERAARVFAD